MQAIKSYLQVTQAWQNKKGQKPLPLSTLATNQEVKKSTSKAKVKGLSLEDILKRGNWFNISTWQKHHKFVSNESAQFQKSIGLGSL